jgi:hypothetical protein
MVELSTPQIDINTVGDTEYEVSALATAFAE